MARLKQNVILMTKEKEEEKEGDHQDIDSSGKNYQTMQQQQQREGMMRTWSQRRVNMGLFDPPTPRTLNHKRQRNVLITNVRNKKFSPCNHTFQFNFFSIVLQSILYMFSLNKIFIRSGG
jgi:hypothetical protein